MSICPTKDRKKLSHPYSRYGLQQIFLFYQLTNQNSLFSRKHHLPKCRHPLPRRRFPPQALSRRRRKHSTPLAIRLVLH